MGKTLRNVSLTLCAVVGFSINSENAKAMVGFERVMADLMWSLCDGRDWRGREQYWARTDLRHIVRKGENLWEISERFYDNGVHAYKIAERNDIGAPYTIRPGDNILIAGVGTEKNIEYPLVCKRH